MTLSSFPPLAWLALSGLLFAYGEYLSKEFTIDHQTRTLLLFLVIDTLGALAWIPPLMEQKDLTVTGTLWSVISLFFTVCIGIFIFGEHLTPMRTLGITLAIGAIVTLSL